MKKPVEAQASAPPPVDWTTFFGGLPGSGPGTDGGRALTFLATRNADLEPGVVMAFGLQPRDDGREVTVFLPESMTIPTMANLRDNGQMAVTVVCPTTSCSVQIKGVWLGERRTDENDRAFLEAYRDALLVEMGMVGVPRSVWQRFSWWPCLALRMEVRETFMQTPGPGAGRACPPLAVSR